MIKLKKPIVIFRQRKCPVCGEKFIPAPQHVYKERHAPYRLVCSWSCVCKSETKKRRYIK